MTTQTEGRARTAAARAARTRAKHERWATEMRAAGWTVATSESGGMPVPDRATNPIHFKDSCRDCARAGVPLLSRLNAPITITAVPGGMSNLYRCREEHEWACWYSVDRAKSYYSDCPCDYCTARRIHAGEAHYPPLVPANWLG